VELFPLIFSTLKTLTNCCLSFWSQKKKKEEEEVKNKEEEEEEEDNNQKQKAKSDNIPLAFSLVTFMEIWSQERFRLRLDN